MTRIDVACAPVAPGWSCQVHVVEDNSATSHRVSVATADLERLDPGASDPSDLVRRSFEFLLQHEPKESILRSFDLTVIGRYFPDWERQIGR
jgi:hypothetical protein